MKAKTFKFRDVLIFILLYALFYFLGYFFIGVTIQGGVYSDFIDKYFNIYLILTKYTLESCSKVLLFFNTPSVISNHSIIVNNRAILNLNYGCLGIGLFSFWWSLIISFPSALKRKIVFLVVGSGAIFFTNVLRVSFVALAYSSNSLRYQSIDHHFLYNLLTCLLLFVFTKKWISNSLVEKEITT